MLLDLLSGSPMEDAMGGLLSFLILLPLLLLSLTVHEYAHGYAAYKEGDSFAKSTGRLTLNPFKHIDPLGLLCMVILGFGWAKPVPVVPQNLKNGNKSMLKVASAGIIANIILAFVSAFLYGFCNYVIFPIATNSVFALIVWAFGMAFFYLAICNISLAVFNFLPIPPLDGYKIFKSLFGGRFSYGFFGFVERYQSIILIILLVLINRFGIIGAITESVLSGIMYLVDFIFVAFR